MKHLTKIKLVNWHGFYEDLIDINGSTLVSGENGCGKSTLIDAIYFVLSGGEEDRFNSAANERATRSVETYMRGRTGIEGNEFLRNDDTLISHIALEFYDDFEKKYLIIGVVLEIQDRKKPYRAFYHLKDTSFDDSYIHDNEGYIINFKMLETSFKNNKQFNDKFTHLNQDSQNKEKIRKNIYGVLGLDGNKYYELLPKAIAFKPIPDVNDFVFNFLMPEKAVDLHSIRTEISSYNEIQRKIVEDREKCQILEEIKNKGEAYLENLKSLTFLDLAKDKIQLDRFSIKVDIEMKELSTLKIEIASMKNEKDDVHFEIQGLDESIYQIEHNEAYKALIEVTNEIEKEVKYNQIAKNKVNSLNNVILKESENGTSLGVKNNLSLFIKTMDFASFKLAVEEYQKSLDLLRDSLSQDKYKIESNKDDLVKEKNELIMTIDRLKKGLRSYKPEVILLINAIEEGVYEQTGKRIKPVPFCEFVNVKKDEEEWRNALEGYLNTRRFDLFVNDDYYDMALSIYESKKFEYKIHGVGLVNSKKIEKIAPLPNSLATKLEYDNEKVERYSNYILGRTICVENELELKKHESAITKTVMVYQNRAARQTKKDIYSNPFLGIDAIKIQLERKETLLNKVTKEIEDANNELSALTSKLDKIKRSNVHYLKEIDNYWDEYSSSLVRLEELNFKREELYKNNGNLVVEVDPLLKKRDEKRLLFNDLEEKLNDKIGRKAYLNESIKHSEDELKAFKSTYQEKLTNLVDEEEYNKFNEDNKLNIAQIDNKTNELKRENGGLVHIITNRMGRYCDRYSFDSNSDIDSLNDFIGEYYRIFERELVTYEEQLEKVKRIAINTFQNSYISEIRKHIEEETKHIKKLNKILKDKPFGYEEERYEFVISKSKDASFGDYYDIFMSNQNFSSNDLFTESLSDKSQELMRDLFARLTSEAKDDKAEKLIQEYTDYRKFMSYEINITNKRGEVSKFSKINKEKSGGETQTPFYVIIAASFDQIIQSRPGRTSTGCIVMLDEAFNNMDESHIDSMMQYFSQLSIQPVIAVPTQRARTIMPYVKTNIVLIKQNNVIRHWNISRNGR